MRLLLTSNGIADAQVAGALTQLLDRDIGDARIAFIPTAANLEEDGMAWLVDDLYHFRSYEPKLLDIVELTALDTAAVTRRLNRADVIVVGGGDTYHLLTWLERHGLREGLPALLRDRVYVGISAGSIVTSPHLGISSESTLWGDLGGKGDPWLPGLGLVDFYFRPHLGSQDFPTSQEDVLERVAPEMPGRLYAADDNAALLVVDGVVTEVGSGRVLTYPK